MESDRIQVLYLYKEGDFYIVYVSGAMMRSMCKKYDYLPCVDLVYVFDIYTTQILNNFAIYLN
jgi:hypothetical protein